MSILRLSKGNHRRMAICVRVYCVSVHVYLLGVMIKRWKHLFQYQYTQRYGKFIFKNTRYITDPLCVCVCVCVSVCVYDTNSCRTDCRQPPFFCQTNVLIISRGRCTPSIKGEPVARMLGSSVLCRIGEYLNSWWAEGLVSTFIYLHVVLVLCIRVPHFEMCETDWQVFDILLKMREDKN